VKGLTAGPDRIRVLRMIARLNVGGPVVHATLLTERLDPRRYDSLLVTGVEDPFEGNYLTLKGKRLERLVTLRTLGRQIRMDRDLAALVELVRLMRRERPVIVHTHTAKAGTLGRLAARLTGVPVIVHTYHGHVFRGYFSPAKTRLFLAVERWLARHTDRLLTVSPAVRRELLDLDIGTPDRLAVVPLGLDLEPFLATGSAPRDTLRRELGLKPTAPLVAIVARLVPIKAHEVFLAAAAKIVARRPETRFLVVGDGERRAELKALAARLGLSDVVVFLGWRSDLPTVYRDVDVVVLTSRNEGSPVSLIEAMAAARPVVATRVGGVPDLVEDAVNGHLVEPDRPEAVAHAVLALLDDSERRETLGLAGRKRVYPAFTAERLLQDVDGLYTALLEQKLGWH
jgi:glycosyltransferase involved in cell wall biosynthesis